MVCVDLCGLRVVLDFTAPALLALLTMLLPAQAVMQTLAACLLHECAHLAAIVLTKQKPAVLHISAAGLRLETAGTAVIPLRFFSVILCAGPLANLAAAAGLFAAGMQGAAAANLSLCLFNLLPYRSTDGGTLLYAWLEERLLPRAPAVPQRVMRLLSVITTLLLLLLMHAAELQNLSLLGMIAYMLLSEFL